jgi:3',5'-cyclic AMP phosphodiesterase CpdA
MDRRGFIKLAGLGAGIVFSNSLSFQGIEAAASSISKAGEDFYFVQLSDTHWGFDGPKVNPDAAGTLKKAVEAVNALEQPPDFVVFTGDLTHTTDDSAIRRQRMTQFQDIAGALKVKTVHYMAGEHDASLDRGEAFQEFFGKLNYTFDHKGVHFIVLDNVSDPGAIIGEKQISWLKADLRTQKPDARIVVLTHRPLFDLYPDWDWSTKDGQAAIDALLPHKNVTVFYGHIHQEHHYMTEHIAHHSAKSLMFPLPAPGSVPKKAPIPWAAASPYKGLGFREIESLYKDKKYEINEKDVTKG